MHVDKVHIDSLSARPRQKGPRKHVVHVLFVFSFAIGSTHAASAQVLPRTDGAGSAPDSMLLRDTAPAWWYRSVAAPQPTALKSRGPSPSEEPIVARARELLTQRPAKAIVLMDGDAVVYAEYKAPAAESSLFWSASIGKTVTSMAVGQAICAGKLSLDAKAVDLLPELQSRALGNATVRDLLRMASGAAEPNADSTIWAPGQGRAFDEGRLNLIAVVAEERVAGAARILFSEYKPGEHMSYKSTDPFVLGLMVRRAVGVPYGDWLQSSVINSMGAAHAGLFDQDREGSGLTASGVRMRLDDWMRFAVWVQRVSKERGCLGDYVRAAMTTQIHNPGVPSNRKFGALFDGYGYLIWTDNRIAPGTVFASGWGGQRISWDRHSDRMVIVFSNTESWMPELYALVRDWNRVGR